MRPSAVTGRRASRCLGARPAWEVPRRLRQFFPASRAALWVRKERCVYLLAENEEARPFWGGDQGETVVGVAWAPDRESVALTTRSLPNGWRVILLRRDGAVLRRLRATGATFLSDGRLAVSRPDGLYLLAGSSARPLASREELERAAGFRARRPLLLSPDPRGFARGYGRNWLALTLWSRGGSWKSIVLAISIDGEARRATPAYRAGGGEGVVSGWAWSPDGQQLFVMAEVPGPPERSKRGRHDHCLDVWSSGGGLRRVLCESRLAKAYQSHFSKLAWAADGKTALLDNGTIVTRGGRVAGRIAVTAGDPAFQVQWEPQPAAAPLVRTEKQVDPRLAG